jgi:hypothetical protein
MDQLPDDLISFIYELKGGIEHREKHTVVCFELCRKFIWISHICGYHELTNPGKDFLTELLLLNINHLKQKQICYM